MKLAVLLPNLVLLTLTAVESLRPHNRVKSAAPVESPPNTSTPLDQQAPSPEKDPKELIRHECEILYSTSADEAQQCVRRLSEALRLDTSAANQDDQIIDNLFGIRLEDIDSIMKISEAYRGPRDLDVPYLLFVLSQLGQYARRVAQFPTDVENNAIGLYGLLQEYAINFVRAYEEVVRAAFIVYRSDLVQNEQLKQFPLYNTVLHAPGMSRPSVPLQPSLLEQLRMTDKVRNLDLELPEQLTKTLPDLDDSALANLNPTELDTLQLMLLSSLKQVDDLKKNVDAPSAPLNRGSPRNAAAKDVDLDDLLSKTNGVDGNAARPNDLTSNLR